MENKKFFALAGIIILVTVLSIVLVGTHVFKSYDVVFETKMGAGVPVQSVMVGQYATEPDKPVMEGYIFQGWYIGDEKYDFDTPVEEDLTLEAKWKNVANNVS